MIDTSFHYPPELLQLLIDAIPKLCKGKRDLLLFFQGAGVSKAVLEPYEEVLRTSKANFNKYHVTRELLTGLNEKGERALRERREILKRVTEFDDFSVCWENDRAAARGLVAQVRDLVNVKDSWTASPACGLRRTKRSGSGLSKHKRLLPNNRPVRHG